MPPKPKLLSDRFWPKVQKTPSHWFWLGAKDPHGYGRFGIPGQYADPSRWDTRFAHRIAWELTYGDVPTDLCVLHVCDTPSCVNPAHLFLGTQLDNIADARAKGRCRTGRAKLTIDEARLVKQIAIGKEIPQAEIAAAFGISVAAVSMIVTGRNWRTA